MDHSKFTHVNLLSKSSNSNCHLPLRVEQPRNRMSCPTAALYASFCIVLYLMHAYPRCAVYLPHWTHLLIHLFNPKLTMITIQLICIQTQHGLEGKITIWTWFKYHKNTTSPLLYGMVSLEKFFTEIHLAL